jgi:hypothetical protein
MAAEEVKLTDLLEHEDELKKIKAKIKKLELKKNAVSESRRKSEIKMKIILGAYFFADDERLKKMLELKTFNDFLSEKDAEFIKVMAHIRFPDLYPAPDIKTTKRGRPRKDTEEKTAPESKNEQTTQEEKEEGTENGINGSEASNTLRISFHEAEKNMSRHQTSGTLQKQRKKGR